MQRISRNGSNGVAPGSCGEKFIMGDESKMRRHAFLKEFAEGQKCGDSDANHRMYLKPRFN